MNIIVSGADGNLGSAVAQKLNSEGHNIFGLVGLDENVSDAEKSFQKQKFDLMDAGAAKKAVENASKTYGELNGAVLTVGGYAGVKIGSNTKLKTNEGDKMKTRKDFHMNTLRYGLRAQVGFENFGVYCNYSLQSLFKKDEGPELYPISLGVTLAF